MKFELSPADQQRALPAIAASSASFGRCNGCGYVFKKRGAVTDMADMMDHKSHCEEWAEKVRIK